MVHTRAQPVEVGQADVIEVGELERATDAFQREGDRGAVAHRQADDPDPVAQQTALLGTFDLAAVAVGAYQAELLAWQHVHEPLRPRVPDPGAVLPHGEPR